MFLFTLLTLIVSHFKTYKKTDFKSFWCFIGTLAPLLMLIFNKLNSLKLIGFNLISSHELQTCDWPRNVVCVSGKRNGEIFDTDDEDHERVPRLLVEDVNFGQRENVVPVSEKS